MYKFKQKFPVEVEKQLSEYIDRISAIKWFQPKADIKREDDEYKKKYPSGNFINLIPLWEAGLYPVGVIDGKFVVYVPPCNLDIK